MRGTSKAPSARSKSMILKRLRTRFGIPVALMAVLALALPAWAAADPLGEVTECSVPTTAFSLTEGPDGNMWYTIAGAKKIGRVTPSCVVEEYNLAMTGTDARTITTGSDGNLWLTELTAKKIARVKPTGTKAEIESSFKEVISTTGSPSVITSGPDGNLWIAMATAGIGRFNPTGSDAEIAASFKEYKTGLQVSANICSIIAGPDGNMWFGDCRAANQMYGRIKPSEPETSILEWPITGTTASPFSIASGSDGKLWFPIGYEEEEGKKRFNIGSVSPAEPETLIKHQTPTTPTPVAPTSVTAGADGNIWAREINSANEKQILKITATGGKYKICKDETKATCTTELNFNATTGEIKAALTTEAMYGSGGIEVTESEAGKWVIDFIGKYLRTNMAQMACGNGTPALEGTCTITTEKDGVPQRLLRITPAGVITEFPLTAATEMQAANTPNALAGSAGENLWYTGNATTKKIGKLGVEPPVAKLPLTVIKEGTGDGTVVSNPIGIECGGTCTAEFTEGGKVTLTASPDSKSLFVSWKGCEKGGVNGRQCTVTMDKAKTVNAKFSLAYDVAVTRVGSGLGKVSSSPGGVLCLSNCSSTSAAFKEGTSVTLTAAPSKHFVFTEWTGDCSGAGTCSLPTLSADKSVGAKFTEVAKFDLTVTKKGGGAGTVKAKQAGINCGATCSSMAAAYYSGEVIELLVPTPGKGSTFGGWSGAGCSGTGTCVVTMSSAKSVEAEFK